MQIKTYTVLTLVVFSSAAFAWQPLTYPIRSQGPYQRSVDTASCFAAATKQTKVDIAREPQIPSRKPATPTSSTGAPSRPPLPPSTFSATPMGASMPAAATAPGASAPAATTATATATGASAPNAASAAPESATTTAATAASAASADGTAETTAAASSVKLPPLPAPEPPMTRYWAAYGACMQARGYIVQ